MKFIKEHIIRIFEDVASVEKDAKIDARRFVEDRKYLPQTKEDFIATYFQEGNRLNPNTFRINIDPNYFKEKLNFISNRGESIDMAADSLTSVSGMDIDESDIVEFVVTYKSVTDYWLTIEREQYEDLKNYYMQEFLSEVRVVNPKKIEKEEPLKDTETIRVFHGFNDFKDVETVITVGLSGKERARRIYSFEAGNNPYGLFVSIDLNAIKRARFAHSGVIIEFSTKVSDLEAPVWVGGRNYFVQGEYTKSFKDLDEREQQRLLNRQRAGESPYDYIAKSDRPELAETIFDNPERQALFVGDLDPNMIKYVWYNERLHENRKLDGEWVRMKRVDFIKKVGLNNKDERYLKYLPNDDFNFDEFVEKYFKGDYNNRSLKRFLEFDTKSEYDLKNYGLFPKQIKQIIKMRLDGEFDKYFNM